MSESGEPRTPKEIAQVKVEQAVRDAWLAMSELVKLENDPDAAPFVKTQEADIWTIKTKADLVLSHIRAPRLQAVS